MIYSLKKQTVFALVLVLSAAVFAQQSGINFSGGLENTWGVFITDTNSQDSNAGRFSTGEILAHGKIEGYCGDGSFKTEGSVSYNAVTNKFDGNFDEAYIDWTSVFFGFRLGRQKTSWGKADAISITDIICPKDMSSLFLEDDKLGIYALRLSFSAGSVSLDAYWIPFFRGAKLPLEKNNALRKIIVPSSVDIPVSALNKTLSVPVTLNDFTKPELKIQNGEYGIKFSAYFSALDFSLYGFYGFDNIPLINYSVKTEGSSLPSEIAVSGSYERVLMFGGDIAVPVGSTVLRAEAAFFPNRNIQLSAKKIISNSGAGKTAYFEKHNQLDALLGIDWMPSDWVITAQYYASCIFGDVQDIKREHQYSHGITVSVSKTFTSELLEISLSGVLGLNDFDSALTPEISYSLTDQIKLSGGAYIFIPGIENKGDYGNYKDVSTVFIKASVLF